MKGIRDPKWDDLREALAAMKEVEVLPWRCADRTDCETTRSIARTWADIHGANLRTITDEPMIYFVRLKDRPRDR